MRGMPSLPMIAMICADAGTLCLLDAYPKMVLIGLRIGVDFSPRRRLSVDLGLDPGESDGERGNLKRSENTRPLIAL